MMDELIDKYVLVEAKDALHKGQGGDSLSRLAECLCILMGGLLERAIDEYDQPEDAT